MLALAYATGIGALAAFKHCRKARILFHQPTKERIRAALEAAYIGLEELKDTKKAFVRVLQWLTRPTSSRWLFMLGSVLSGVFFVLISYIGFLAKLYRAPDGALQMMNTHHLFGSILAMALTALIGYLMMSVIAWWAIRYLATREQPSWRGVIGVMLAVIAVAYIAFGLVIALLSSASLEGSILADGHFVSYLFSWDLLGNRWWLALSQPLASNFTMQLTSVHQELVGAELAAPALFPVCLLLLALLSVLCVVFSEKPRDLVQSIVLRLHDMSERFRDKSNLPIDKLCWLILAAGIVVAIVLAWAAS